MIKILTYICIAILVGCQQDKPSHIINTVQGPIDISTLGMCLTHEHIMSNYGKDIDKSSQYDSVQLFNQVIPYLEQLKALGVHSIFDCTTAYFGRRVDLLQTISEASGVQIITNTGYYGAADDRYIPQLAYTSSPQEIAAIWIDEYKNGIEGTAIKPGFVKLAFDDGKSPSAIDKKLLEAGVLTHLATGLTMAVHTGANLEAVSYQRALLDKYDVHPSAWIWTHANKLQDDELLLAHARQGAWISLDGVNADNTATNITRLNRFKQEKLLHKVLISHDGNGFPAGGEIRPFDAIFNVLIPSMIENGFTDDDIHGLLVENPRVAFGVKVRMEKERRD